MCIYAFALNPTPDLRLVIVGNRDEDFRRASLSAHFWKENKDIVAGIDLRDKGTWLGLSKNRKVAFLTNYRNPLLFKNGRPSRGNIVKDFLLNNYTAEEFSEKLKKTSDLFNGYNIVFGTFDELFYFSNISKSLIKINDASIHSISNAFLDSNWFKCVRLKSLFSDLLNRKHFQLSDVFSVLSDDKKSPDELLPSTNVKKEWEKGLSSIFVKMPFYGTVFSYFIIVRRDYSVEFYENDRLNVKISAFYFKT